MELPAEVRLVVLEDGTIIENGTEVEALAV